MELQSSSSSSASQCIPSFWDYIHLLVLRPILAISFAALFIFVGWLLAWKLVLVHVPLVQEIFGLRKKKEIRKPPTRKLSRYYNSINAQNRDLNCLVSFMSKSSNAKLLSHVYLWILFYSRLFETR